MDLDKEAFKFGRNDKVLKLIFTQESAKHWINLLNVAIRPKEENGMGYENEFYVCMCGSCIDVSDLTFWVTSAATRSNQKCPRFSASG